MKNLQSLISLQGCSGRNVGQSAAKHGNDTTTTRNRHGNGRRLYRALTLLTLLLTIGVGQMWADNFPNGGKIFLKVNSNWKSDGARFAAYFYGNGETWVSMTNQTGDYYVCDAPNGYPNVIFCRMNGSTSTNNWSNKWNQTGDLSFTSGKNLFTLPSSAWDGSTTTWETYQLTSTASLSGSTSITTAQTSTLTPSLSSNTTYNEIKSTTYSVTTNPGSAGSVTSAGVFSASAAGTYTVTATVTYNAKGFSGITKTATATKSITVSAAAEATHTVSITYVCASPSATVSTAASQTIGEVTASSITAPTVAGYTFSSWTLGAGISNQSGSTTANPISVKTLSSGAYTMQANYTEDLNSPWIVTGGNKIVTTGTTWRTTADVNNKMVKKTGHSTESVAYFSVTTTGTNTGSANTNYQFKLYNTSTSAYWGLSGTGQYYYNRSTGEQTMTSPGINIELRADVAGTYEIKVDYSSTPKITITYPTRYTVTYSVSPSGTANAITTSPSVSSGGYVASGTSVTFTHGDANAGYEWYRWENGSGSSLGTGSTYTTSITANTTVVAKYRAKTYTISLDQQTSAAGYNASGTASVPTVTYNTALPSISGTMPTTTGNYGFMGFYTETNGGGERLTDAEGVWIASVDGYTDADKKWIHDGDVTLYAYYKQAEITELTFVNAIVSPSATVQVTPTIEPTPAASTHIDWRVLYSNGTALPSQPAMSVYNTTGVQFTAPASSATYKVEAVLRTGTTPGAGTTIHTKTETFQVAGDHTVTVLYKCGDMTIQASTEVTGSPLEWSDDITAPSITGYTFSSWTAGDGVTIKDGEGSTATTHIKATYDGTLTANYTRKRMIYFYNTLDWENVYVYFYKNDSYWNVSNGTGADQTYTFTNTPYSEGKHGQMQPIEEGSSIYYFDAEGAGVNALYTTVVFTELDQHGYGYFAKTSSVKNKVIRRSDYKSTTMPMFVPLADQTPTSMNGGLADYYGNGYWMNYPENTGYTLKIYSAWNATKETAAVRSIPFPYSDDKTMPLKLNVEFNDAGTNQYWFMIYRNDGTYLGNEYNYNQNYNSEQIITGGDNKCKITTSAPGIYTLTLTYHDNGSGTLNYYIDVDFPVATGDYRIVYKDNASWSHGAHDGLWNANSWKLASDVIRKATTEAKTDTVSFYVAKGAGITAAMKFQYVSAISDGGVVTWTDVPSGSITIPDAVDEAGVYNFIITQPAGGASISLEKAEPYTGNYYIRTDCAGNTKWDSYKTLDHQMTYSDYAAENSGYTHYYCHWVTTGMNVKFCIANDYSLCISDTLVADYGTAIAGINASGNLTSANANIRFMWNQETNKLSRAYIGGSGTITDRFLVLEGDEKMYDENGNALTGDYQDHDKSNVYLGTDNQVILHDDENFVYERTIKVNTTAEAKLTAKYNSKVQYFIGGADETVELLGGATSATKYLMRIVYDFKTNRLVRAYMPEGEIDRELAIHADIMLVREHQNAGQQLVFANNDAKLTDVQTVYGIMRFNRYTLNNKNATAPHGVVADPKSSYERGLYWISFPFDVNLGDVFGFGTYGTHWIIMEYDGAERADKGYWQDSQGFWKYITNRTGKTLEAGKGYVLALDLDLMRDNDATFWANGIEQVELFFPSSTNVSKIKQTDVEITVPEHACTKDRRTDEEKANEVNDINKDRTIADSHWNIIGVPSYANYGSALKDENGSPITWNEDPETEDLPFLYEWNMVDNTYTPQSGTTYPFKSMHAYMVQYHGKLKWSLASATPPSIAARYAEAPKNVEFRLELQQNDKMTDQTFVKLMNDANVQAGFVFDEDLMKEFNKDKANIYTIISNYLPAAGNTLPTSEQTTIVPVGVKIAANDDYTFTIPDGTSGVGVTLIDTETGVRTNLSALDYTVSLEEGTYNERFVMEISPIQQVITDVQASEINDQKSDVRKQLIDGLLYIVRDGKMYDARGAKVE